MDEIREHNDEVLAFIDELHTVVGAGASEGSMGAGNMLKLALARGELHVIGILRGLRDRYEAHHQLRYTDEALVAAVELSDRYITDRFLPDKAIDLIDQAGARVRSRTKTPTTDLRDLEQELEGLQREKDQAVSSENYERASNLRDRIREVQQRMHQVRGGDEAVPEVTVSDIAGVVARSTGIPVSQLTEEEKDRLLRLDERLHERVVGQDEAVAAVSEAVRRSRAGLGDPDRPVGSFLFLGPTGVGKTELARALAAALFGEAERMVRLDMSLTEAVRRRPHSVVLLDEIERAQPDVFNTLLQLLDDGRLTDSQGRAVDFRNTVVIMTSNLGSDLIVGRRGRLGFDGGSATDREDEGLRNQIMRRLRESFRPEFGARPLRRTIQREIDNELSRLVLRGDIRPGHRVQVGVEGGEFGFRQLQAAATP